MMKNSGACMVGGRGNPYSAPRGAAALRGKVGDSVLAGPLYDSFICQPFLLSVPLSAGGMFMNISTDMI